MKKIFSFLVLAFLAFGTMHAQAPRAFKYQTVVRLNENPITDQAVRIKISILHGSVSGPVLYSETHSVTTNAFGLVNLTIGSGTPLSGRIDTISWYNGNHYLKTELDPAGGSSYQAMGIVQLLSVPYALYSETTNTKATFSVTGNKALDTDSALFEVKDRNGKTVFAVYEDGVQVIVDESAKGGRGGFAVGGRSPGKEDIIEDILKVTPDSVRIYINDPGLIKGGRGGFAVGGRTPAKGIHPDYLWVNPDSTRIYVIEAGKGGRGGFAVGGRTPEKGLEKEYFTVSPRASVEKLSSTARILWYPLKEAFLTGRILVESSDSVGTNSMATGFESKAIGNWSQALGYKSIARKDYSTAIGRMAVAGGLNSFAFGDSARAMVNQSYALGAGALATGVGSYAIGSIGRDTLGIPTSSVTSASGQYSIAIGQGSQSTSKGSMSFGMNNTSSGTFSLAMGYNAVASGTYSLALKSGTATGSGAIAIGSMTQATGSNSLAIGSGYCLLIYPPKCYYTVASGSNAIALGRASTASSLSSTAINGNASGEYTFALGGYAQGNYSYSLGNRVIARAYGSTVIGSFNDTTQTAANRTAWNTGEELFVIGNGTNSVPSNALTILKNGYVGIGDASPSYWLDVLSTQLGLMQGNRYWARFSGLAGSAGNVDQLRIYHRRYALSGTGWNSAEIRIQKTTDLTDMHYIAFRGMSDYTSRLDFGYGTTPQMVILQSGYVGIGVVSPLAILQINGQGISTSATWATSSDERVKQDISALQGSLEQIMQLRPVHFRYTTEYTDENNGYKGNYVGFIAQEVEKVCPEMVSLTSQKVGAKTIPDFRLLNQGKLIPMLVNAMQEQQAIIDVQQEKIRHLEQRLNSMDQMQSQINELKELLGKSVQK